MQKLIGLAGFSGAGKNYTANLICHLRAEFQQVAFADPLKAAMSSIFGFSAEQLHSLERSQVDRYWDATPRELMQLVGTDLFRNQYRQDVWIKAVARRVQQYDHVVITDVRFRNELDWIRQTGGRVFFYFFFNSILSDSTASAICFCVKSIQRWHSSHALVSRLILTSLSHH